VALTLRAVIVRESGRSSTPCRSPACSARASADCPPRRAV